MSGGPRGSFLPGAGAGRGCWAALGPLRELQQPPGPPGQLSQDHTRCQAEQRKLLMDANGAGRILPGGSRAVLGREKRLTRTSTPALAVALGHPSGLQLQQIRAEEDLQLLANRGGRWVGKSEVSATTVEDFGDVTLCLPSIPFPPGNAGILLPGALR